MIAMSLIFQVWSVSNAAFYYFHSSEAFLLKPNMPVTNLIIIGCLFMLTSMSFCKPRERLYIRSLFVGTIAYSLSCLFCYYTKSSFVIIVYIFLHTVLIIYQLSKLKSDKMSSVPAKNKCMDNSYLYEITPKSIKMEIVQIGVFFSVLWCFLIELFLSDYDGDPALFLSVMLIFFTSLSIGIVNWSFYMRFYGYFKKKGKKKYKGIYFKTTTIYIYLYWLATVSITYGIVNINKTRIFSVSLLSIGIVFLAIMLYKTYFLWRDIKEF